MKAFIYDQVAALDEEAIEASASNSDGLLVHGIGKPFKADVSGYEKEEAEPIQTQGDNISPNLLSM